MPAGRPLEPAGNGRPRWMTAHREAARRPWTEPGVQADSSVAPSDPAVRRERANARLGGGKRPRGQHPPGPPLTAAPAGWRRSGERSSEAAVTVLLWTCG